MFIEQRLRQLVLEYRMSYGTQPTTIGDTNDRKRAWALVRRLEAPLREEIDKLISDAASITLASQPDLYVKIRRLAARLGRNHGWTGRDWVHDYSEDLRNEEKAARPDSDMSPRAEAWHYVSCRLYGFEPTPRFRFSRTPL